MEPLNLRYPKSSLRNHGLFTGRRICYFKRLNKMKVRVGFGIIKDFNPASSKIDIILDSSHGSNVRFDEVVKEDVFLWDNWKHIKPFDIRIDNINDMDNSNVKKLYAGINKAVNNPNSKSAKQYFTSKMPINKFDLSLVRAIWLWASTEIFHPLDGKSMIMPHFFLIDNALYPGLYGVWRSTGKMGINPMKIRFLVNITATMLHEMIHQYAMQTMMPFYSDTEKLKIYEERTSGFHGKFSFLQYLKPVSIASGVTKNDILEIGFDDVIDESAEEERIDIKVKPKFLLLVGVRKVKSGSTNEKETLIGATRIQINNIKHMELFSRVVNSYKGIKFSIYEAPYRCFQDSSLGTIKQDINLRPLSSQELLLLADPNKVKLYGSSGALTRDVRNSTDFISKIETLKNG